MRIYDTDYEDLIEEIQVEIDKIDLDNRINTDSDTDVSNFNKLITTLLLLKEVNKSMKGK